MSVIKRAGRNKSQNRDSQIRDRKRTRDSFDRAGHLEELC